MGRINPQIIWLHSPNNLKILLVYAFVPLQFFYFYRLKSVIAKPGRNASAPTFSPGEGTNACPSTFSWHKINFLSSSSVLLFFIPLEISDSNPGVDGKDNSPPPPPPKKKKYFFFPAYLFFFVYFLFLIY